MECLVEEDFRYDAMTLRASRRQALLGIPLFAGFAARCWHGVGVMEYGKGRSDGTNVHLPREWL